MRTATIIAAIAAGVGCGPSNDKDGDSIVVINGTPNSTANNVVVSNNRTLNESDQAIVDGFTAPSEAHDAAEGALSLTVEAVVLASVAATQGQQLVTTGTLTQSGQQFTYAAGPSDKLVIKWTEGPPTDLYVSQLDGNFEAESVDAFFGANHVVAARLVRAGLADFEVASGKSGGNREGGIRGSITEGSVTYQVDLQEVGTTKNSVEITSADYESESTMTGTITAPGLELVAEETYYYHHVVFDNSVENRRRTANSRWTFNGNEYAVNGVLIQTSFTNAYPSEFDYWRIEGAVTENGNVVGQMTYEEDQLAIDIVLQLTSGEKLVLERHVKAQQ